MAKRYIYRKWQKGWTADGVSGMFTPGMAGRDDYGPEKIRELEADGYKWGRYPISCDENGETEADHLSDDDREFFKSMGFMFTGFCAAKENPADDSE